MIASLAVSISIALIAVVILFQLALAFGVPWGNLAMGGKYPGKFPPVMRVAALVQIVILTIIGVVISVRGGIIFPEWFFLADKIIWGVVVFNVIGLVANLATRSKWERIIWAPIAVVLLVCSLIVALS